MEKADGSVIVKTIIDTKDATKDFDKVGRKAEEVADRMSKAFAAVGKTIAAAFAIQKIVQFGKEAVSAAETQEEAERKLETIMRQRMGATNDMIQSVKDLCSAEQGLGVVGDEVQMAGAQQLATFLTTSESLKQLIPAMNDLAVQQNGVNVSASNMVSIGNLMGKVMQGQTSALRRVGISFSEAEEKILKYGSETQKAATLAKVIANNVGNMNDVLANTPAGQIQQLKNNFGDLMELLGMGIQNIITPMVKVLNRVVSALQRVAVAFRDVTAMITGVDALRSVSGGGAGGLGSASEALDDETDSTEDLADAEKEEAKAKKKQVKEQQKYLSGLDEIRRFELNKDDDEDEDKKEPTDDFKPIAKAREEAGKTDTILDGILDKLKELAGIFKEGFWDGLGDYAPRLQGLKDDLDSIKNDLKDIWTDPEVTEAMNRYISSAVYALGQITGAAASIGLTIAQLIVGGIANFLSQSKDRIKKHLVAMFDVGAEIWTLVGNFAKTFARIFEVFGGEVAQGILGDLLSIAYEVYAVIAETTSKLVRDLLGLALKPIMENADKIRTAIENTLSPIKTFLDGILSGVISIVDGIRRLYDEHISPFIGNVTSGISEIVGTLLDGYNQYVAPVLQGLADRFKALMDGPFGELINNIVDILGIVFDELNNIWVVILQPLFGWIAENIMPVLGQIIEIVGGALLSALEWLVEKLGAFTQWCTENPEVIKTITDIVVAFFAAWAVTSLISGIASLISSLASGVAFAGWAAKTFITLLGQGGAFTLVGEALSGLVSLLGGPLVVGIGVAIAAGILLYKNWDKVCEWAGNLKKKVAEAWGSIKEKVKDTVGSVIDKAIEMKSKVEEKVEGLKTAAGQKFTELKNNASQTWENIKTTAGQTWGLIKTTIGEKISNIKSNAETTWNNIKTTAGTKWDGIKSAIEEKVSSLKSNVIDAWSNIKTDLGEKWDAIKTSAGQLGDKFLELKDGAFKKVSDFLSGTFNKAFGEIQKIGEDLVTYFSGDFLTSWGNAWQGIVDKVGSVFSGIVDFITSPVNTAIDKINDVIGWINEKLNGIWDTVSIPPFTIGGFDLGPVHVDGYTFEGFGLRNFSSPPTIGTLPRLAKGAVIPPNAPFAAVLGDQKQGMNIEAPLETIKQAMMETMGARNTGNTYRVSAEVGGRTILEIILDEAQMMRMQTGRNPFEMG